MSLQAGSRLGPYELTSAVSVSERAGALSFGAPTRLPFPKDSFQFFGVRSLEGERFLLERWDSEAFTEPIRLIRSWPRLFEK